MRRRAFSPLMAISGTVCVLVALPALTGLGVWGGVAPVVLVALGALIVALTMRSSRQGGSRHRDAAPDEDETWPRPEPRSNGSTPSPPPPRTACNGLLLPSAAMRRPGSLLEILTLDPFDTDRFVGFSPAYSWGRVYGGQVIGQALRAACATVPPEFTVHSLHANFILGGKPDEPIRYEVDRIRDGRSFMTRRVVARQDEGAILNLDASFHAPERDVSTPGAPLPQILPGPETLPRGEWEAFGDVREVPLTRSVDPGRSVMWIRTTEDLGDDPALHACAFAYLSDHNPMDAIVASHPLGLSWDTLMTASLDHALWIHRPFRADQWLLFDIGAGGLHDARGLAMGTVHTVDGVHVASIAQEGLVRSPRTPG